MPTEARRPRSKPTAMPAATHDSKDGYAARLPILHLLCSLGWNFLTTAQALAMRGSTREVLLKARLVEVLRTRRYEYEGQWYALSGSGIEQVVRELSAVSLAEGLLPANERVYGKLASGITVAEFMPDGKTHQLTIPVIDWSDPAANCWDVTEALEVLSAGGTHARTPDVVCYVNGLPLVVIEAERPSAAHGGETMVAEGIRRHLRHQRPDEIAHLFAYAQLLLAVGQTKGRYGTTGTAAKAWAHWREEEFDACHQATVKNVALSAEVRTRLFAGKPAALAACVDALWAEPMVPTDPDRLLIGLLTPARLLDFVRGYVLFDRKVGKLVARYPQFFGSRAVLSRMQEIRPDGGREGGVVWHTLGSGKRFTMVFVIQALLLANALTGCRVIIVTDRVDLETQLSRNMIPGGDLEAAMAPQKDGAQGRALTGRDLARRIGRGTERITVAPVQKFNAASRLPECRNDSANLIVLVDEDHCSCDGATYARMRKALPRAACVVFTGTPLLRDHKASNKFGPILHAYTPQRAVADGTVAPLLYEERVPRPTVDSASGRIERIARDIATHFSEQIKRLGRGLKGQVVTNSKLDAIRYKKALDETARVTSAVVMSPPHVREGGTAIDEHTLPEVQQWWTQTVVASGKDAQTHEKQVVADFGTDEGPDLLIVVDKLLTAFDEPRNTVLYIDKPLHGRPLIQAVARVNRLHDDKRFGMLVDYRGVLNAFDTAIGLTTHQFGGFDIADVEGLYRPFETEYRRLAGLQVTGREVREPDGVYRVHGPAGDSKRGSGEIARSEIDLIRTRLRKSIEHDLDDDPYAQQVFAELLRSATGPGGALQQRALLIELEHKIGARQTPGIPKALGDDVLAKACFGAIKLGLRNAFDPACEGAYVDEARATAASVTTAVAENWLNPHSVEAVIRQALLPRLFSLAGLEPAKRILDHVVHIAGVRLGR